MHKIRLKDFMPYALMLPSILIGTLAMISYGVSSSIWIQNILIWILGTAVSCAFLIRSRKKHGSKNDFIPAIIILALLLFPFGFSGIEGIHRWLAVGPINLYVASIFLPLLLIYLWKLSVKHHERYVVSLTVIVLVILLLQPDAGQVTAFACAAAIILWKQGTNKTLKVLILSLSAIAVILSWIFLDNLAPVAYVEDIIFLVADMGAGMLILGTLSLVLLVIPFFVLGNVSIASQSLGVYFLMMMAVTFIGNFPMPVMGYGTSPIIGYLIAVTWVVKRNAAA
ncbi:hypothetical protein VBD025_16590 [Virgibacillus flavescens]|uniref:hypothetical protein n=1 Tax=Virgibacillus flavescens TaxID=1611422 RepID=UPI003D329B13